VAGGRLTPAEATDLTKIVESFIRTIEVFEFDERLSRLENRS